MIVPALILSSIKRLTYFPNEMNLLTIAELTNAFIKYSQEYNPEPICENYSIPTGLSDVKNPTILVWPGITKPIMPLHMILETSSLLLREIKACVSGRNFRS